MATHILVVDDELDMQPLMQLRFRTHIRKKQYRFSFATSGKEALSRLAANEDIFLVLCDINMPEMDGLTLLPLLMEQRPQLRVVMVSAYGDLENIRRAMNLGAFDFVTKPIDFEDLETTIEKTIREIALVKRAELTAELEQRNERLAQLDRMKSQFVTDLSHEFRTPLTSLLGAKDLISQNPDRWLDKGLDIIGRQGQTMLDLVNQLLEVRKLESGEWTVRYVRNNIIPYIAYLLEPFEALLEKSGLTLSVEYQSEELIMDYDPDKILRILSNLMSNAIKYSPVGSDIAVSVGTSDSCFRLSISDKGVGMDAELIDRIFKRFQQGESPSANGILNTSDSSGIGLHLVKELVDRLKGRIEVQSQVGAGTTFVLFLPVEQTVAEPIEMVELPVNTDAVDDLPLILIVEDNPDIATFLSANLEDGYRVEVAWDGETGLQRAIHLVPDLVLSDVVLPGKDGIELCATLKQDQRTSHIPVVLLTARASEKARLKGLESGADAYLEKPIRSEELRLRLAQLVDLRRQLQQRFQSLESLQNGNVAPKDQEDAFLLRLRQIIEHQLENEGFGISELCQELTVSRTQLHRKVKALTNKSTSLFVRSIRLQRAKDLLASTDLNISEIAFKVGYSDPKYFSHTFLQEFGKRPTSYRN